MCDEAKLALQLLGQDAEDGDTVLLKGLGRLLVANWKCSASNLKADGKVDEHTWAWAPQKKFFEGTLVFKTLPKDIHLGVLVNEVLQVPQSCVI